MKIPENHRILIIDDNPAIHDDIRKVLQPFENSQSASIQSIEAVLFGETPITSIPDINYEVDSAYQGEEGYNLVCEAISANRSYALALVDIRMPPGLDGLETIKRIWNIDPNIQIAICTAYSDYTWTEIIKELGQTDRLLILKKPFDNVEIRQIACALCKKWNLDRQVKNQLSQLSEQVNLRTAELIATLDSTIDGIIAVNKDGKILHYNQQFFDTWNIKNNKLKNNKFSDLLNIMVQKIRRPDKYLHKVKLLDISVDHTSFDELQCKDNRIIEAYSQPQIIDNQYQGRVWCYRDVTKRRKLENQLAHQATHDILTDLPNRALLLDRVQLAISQSKREKKLMALLFLDLDQFKLINDTFGHDMGDKLLQEVAKRLSKTVRDSDTVARIGGDEYVILLPTINKIDDAALIAQKCLDAINAPLQLDGNELKITCSIGISIYPKDGKDFYALLRTSDIAMYRAKEVASNKPQFYTTKMNDQASKCLLLKNNLNIALENNEFSLYYQPIFDLRNGGIVGVEALLRWQHPKLGIIPPFDFIPLAEEIGLIVPISEWALNAACLQHKIWCDNGIAPIRMLINLSVQQFEQINIIEMIKKIVLETHFNPNLLDIGLAEAILMENHDIVNNKISVLKEMGVNLVITDFGAGYSSLSYLTQLPVAKIKIDKSFVNYISAPPEDNNLILTIIMIAKTLKIKLIAEGVETQEQLDFLVKNNCDEAQGYYFSRPLTEVACTALLKKNHK